MWAGRCFSVVVAAGVSLATDGHVRHKETLRLGMRRQSETTESHVTVIVASCTRRKYVTQGKKGCTYTVSLLLLATSFELVPCLLVAPILGVGDVPPQRVLYVSVVCKQSDRGAEEGHWGVHPATPCAWFAKKRCGGMASRGEQNRKQELYKAAQEQQKLSHQHRPTSSMGPHGHPKPKSVKRYIIVHKHALPHEPSSTNMRFKFQ